MDVLWEFSGRRNGSRNKCQVAEKSGQCCFWKPNSFRREPFLLWLSSSVSLFLCLVSADHFTVIISACHSFCRLVCAPVFFFFSLILFKVVPSEQFTKSNSPFTFHWPQIEQPWSSLSKYSLISGDFIFIYPFSSTYQGSGYGDSCLIN